MAPAASTLVVLVTLLVFVQGPAGSKEEAGREPPKAPDTAALAYAAWLAELPAEEADRVAGVERLGAFDDARITAALLMTLREAKTGRLRLAAARSLAKLRREGTLPALTELLDGTEDGALRNAAATGIGRHGDAGVALLEARLVFSARKGNLLARLAELTGGEHKVAR